MQISSFLLLEQTGVSIKDLTNVLEAVSKKQTQDTFVLSSLADLYIEQKLFDKGLSVLAKLIKTTQDIDIKNKITCQIAYIQFATGKYDQLEKRLSTSLKKKNLMLLAATFWPTPTQ